MPPICHCPFGDIYVLQLCCPTECIAGCGWFCCYKICNPHSVACWAVLEHFCLVPRQGNTNFIPCICFQVQWTCALATVQCNLRKSTFGFANATSHDHESHFLSVSWHPPNESFLIAKANYPHSLKKTASPDPVSPDPQPSFCSRVKINFNAFVLWESVAFFPLKEVFGLGLFGILPLLNYAEGRCQIRDFSTQLLTCNTEIQALNWKLSTHFN